MKFACKQIVKKMYLMPRCCFNRTIVHNRKLIMVTSLFFIIKCRDLHAILLSTAHAVDGLLSATFLLPSFLSSSNVSSSS